MNILICRAQRYPIRRILRCPTCKTRRRMLCHDEAWYGTTVTCCHCGDRWQDGERSQRPNRRGWRTEAAANAATAWIAAGPYDPAAHRHWLNEQIGTSA